MTTGRTAASSKRLVVGASVLGFVVLEALAIAHYPGGTWLDRHHPGHHFTHNFLCDLLLDPALNGVPSPTSAALATAGMLCMAPGLAAFFALMGRRLITALGLCAAVGLSAVTLLPSDEWPRLHGVMVVLAGPPGLLAAVLAVAGDPRRLTRLLGAATLLAGGLNLLLYVRTRFLGAALGPEVPTVQRLATVLLLAWMLAVTARPPD